MYQAIVFLPLLGAIIAALIAIAGAHARHPGGTPAPRAEDHAHGPVDPGHARAAPAPDAAHAALAPSAAEPDAHAPAASGSRFAEVVTTVFLFASMLLWTIQVRVRMKAQNDTRLAVLPWIVSGD